MRVEVTNADIAAARRAWRTARDGNAAPARVELLYADLRRLVSAQAQQIADVAASDLIAAGALNARR